VNIVIDYGIMILTDILRHKIAHLLHQNIILEILKQIASDIICLKNDTYIFLISADKYESIAIAFRNVYLLKSSINFI